MKLRDTHSDVLDEISIVNVFTRLIFDAEAELQGAELNILRMLGEMDGTLMGSNRREISEYLQAMGVDEMISAVDHVRQQLALQFQPGL